MRKCDARKSEIFGNHIYTLQLYHLLLTYRSRDMVSSGTNLDVLLLKYTENTEIKENQKYELRSNAKFN